MHGRTDSGMQHILGQSFLGQATALCVCTRYEVPCQGFCTGVNFLRTDCFPERLHCFTFPPARYEGSSFSTPSVMFLIILFFFIIIVLMNEKYYFTVILVYISLMINDVKQLFCADLLFIDLFRCSDNLVKTTQIYNLMIPQVKSLVQSQKIKSRCQQAAFLSESSRGEFFSFFAHLGCWHTQSLATQDSGSRFVTDCGWSTIPRFQKLLHYLAFGHLCPSSKLEMAG